MFVLLDFTSGVYFKTVNLPDEDKWKTEIKTKGGAVQDYTINYQNLVTISPLFCLKGVFQYDCQVPLTTYYFRVIAYNEFGISTPCASEETVIL